MDLCSFLELTEKQKNKEQISVKLIGIKNITDISSMFQGCNSLLSSPDISKWDTKNITNMRAIFSGCKSLKSIVIPKGVTKIGNSTFEWCKSLKSVVIPEGVTEIGKGAFRECSSLKSVVIPEGVTSISDSAFSGCESLNWKTNFLMDNDL